MAKTQPIILLLETATSVCSVALSCGDKVIVQEETSVPNAHSTRLSLLIDQAIKEANITYKDIAAVAVSKGPGSYTGLRIGVSTAKGFAYGLDIPLISIETLRILEKGAKRKFPESGVVAMIDARRMEVYCEIYDSKGNVIKPLSAAIIEEGIYDDCLNKEKD